MHELNHFCWNNCERSLENYPANVYRERGSVQAAVAGVVVAGGVGGTTAGVTPQRARDARSGSGCCGGRDFCERGHGGRWQ